MTKKISSVIELARYKTGDTAYWVALRPIELMPQLDEDDEWMYEHHPKTLYSRNPGKRLWPYNAKLPKLHHLDFDLLVNILRSELLIEQFIVCEVVRSNRTGEFLYGNQDDEWMPENNLFDTNGAASRERLRILRLLSRWSNEQE